MILLLFFSFLAGIATVLSPCIIPILPAVLSGGLNTGKLRPLGIILGLIISFSFFTLTLTALVHATGVSPDILRYVAIGAIAFFGATMIFPSLSDAFEKLTAGAITFGNKLQSQQAAKNTGFIGGFLLGISLGLLWTPCAGPILASVTTLALTGNVNLTAVFLTIAYSLGAGVPLLLIAYGGNRALTSSRFLSSKAATIRKVFGVIMIATALAMLLNLDRQLQILAIQYLPNFQPDSSATVQQALQNLKNPNTELSSQLQGKPLDKVSMINQAGGALPDLGPAPELTGITSWINSTPLTLASLRGKVVLVDFWTYTCINCIRSLPSVVSWYNTYKDKGFVIIGVHTPEFEFEKNRDNVVDATKRFSILYPVAQDNNYATWNAYQNQYWPAHYLIDTQGHIRQVHFGEGNYTETENAIRSLLDMDPLLKEDTGQPSKRLTPETYLGYSRAQSYTGSMQAVKQDSAQTYSFSPPLADDQVGLSGVWSVGSEAITSGSSTSKLVLHFNAGKVHLVMGGKSTTPLTVLLDGNPLTSQDRSSDYAPDGKFLVAQDREYTLVDFHGGYGSHVLELTVPTGIGAYAFTFGE